MAPRRPRPSVVYLGSALVLAFLTWADYATGYELELFALYIVPVGLATWWGNRRAGISFAVAAAVCWFTSDRLSGHPYSNGLFVYWAAFMRFVVYLTAAVALSAIRRQIARRDDLLRVISHDLRAPLAAASGQAQILRGRSGGDAWVAARADAILRAAKRMDGMIEDLVDGARRDAGHLRLELQPVELRGFVAELLERMAGALDVSRIEATLLAGDALAVTADPARLERVLVNLLSNALKYSPGGGKVRLEAEARGVVVVISVTDEGPGIAAEDLPHLFERYYRGKEAGRAEGTGLGLHGARMLVEAHGGRIRVENLPRGGAAFRVELPAA
jgi:signal transduction histidine kinase